RLVGRYLRRCTNSCGPSNSKLFAMILSIQKGSRLYKCDCEINRDNGRIDFVKSPFVLKDEIKTMRGARWNPDRRIWSIDDCPRNDFRLRYLAGEDVYAWFDRLLVRGDYSDITERVRAVCGPDAEYMPHQADLSDATLTYHYQIWGAEM